MSDAVVELRVAISPAGLLGIAAIVLAGAVVTGVAIREARRPRLSRATERDPARLPSGNGNASASRSSPDRT